MRDLIKNKLSMDNAEILKEMGFELLTGDMWHHSEIGYINVPIDDDLSKIATKIFEKGYLCCQGQMKKALGI